MSEKSLGEHPRVSPEEMEGRVVRFKDIEGKGSPVGVPLMFIDSILPGHRRMNYAIIGDTASEDPEFRPILDQPHDFQIGMFMCPPETARRGTPTTTSRCSCPCPGPFAFSTATTLTGRRRGDRYRSLGHDLPPPGLWRSLENAGEEDAWCFAVLETHEAYAGKDPYWPDWLVGQASEKGLEVDDKGKMIKPPNFAELRDGIEDDLLHRG